MNGEATYLGKTAEMIVNELSKDEPSTSTFAHLLRAYTDAMQAMIDIRFESIKDLYTELARDSGRDPHQVQEETERSYLRSIYTEQVPLWGSRLAQVIGKSQVLEIWNGVILSLESDEPEVVRAAIDAALSEMDALDPGCTKNGIAKRIIDAMRSELTAKPSLETVLSFAVYELGRTGVDDRRDRIREGIEERLEALTVRDALLEAMEKALADAAVQEDAGLVAENEYRIDWQGSRVDCCILIKCLAKYGYIKISKPNQYIAKHFSFKGEIKTSESLGKLKPERDGSFTEFPEYLKIPAQR